MSSEKMPIIDFRARPNTAEYMKMYDGQDSMWTDYFKYPKPPKVELGEFVAELEVNNIQKAVFTGRQTIVNGQMTKGITNDYVAEAVAAHPDRIIGVAGVDPTTGVTGVREVRRAITELGLKGLSLDPFGIELLPDDRRLYPFYSVAAELNVPVILTVGPRVGRYGNPEYVDRVAGDFPETTIVLSHGCYPQVTELIALGLRRPNVFLEASIYEFLPGAEPFIEAARTVLQDKVVYASAFPFNPLAIRSKFEELGFDDDVLRKLMHTNAERVLGL